jgi:FKBP-type peptidyl-prolyl cis-trans isomerase 2
MSRVQAGDVVQVHYTGWLAGGAVFGTSRDKGPVEFTAGGGQMIEALSQAVLGMGVGETKRLTVSPEQGFGPRQPGLQHRVPRRALPGDAHVGDLLLAGGAGPERPVWLRELDGDSAVLDGNHPLAGLTLLFEIEVVGVRPA